MYLGGFMESMLEEISNIALLRTKKQVLEQQLKSLGEKSRFNLDGVVYAQKLKLINEYRDIEVLEATSFIDLDRYSLDRFYELYDYVLAMSDLNQKTALLLVILEVIKQKKIQERGR